MRHLEEDRPERYIQEGLERAHDYFDSGVDCVFPIGLWQREPLAAFVAEAGGPVNALASPRAPSAAELAELGVARISWGSLLHGELFEEFARRLDAIPASEGDRWRKNTRSRPWTDRSDAAA